MRTRTWWIERIVLLSAWSAAVAAMAWHHVFWRDEGRALSIALLGDGVAAMLVQLRGEGHPALWYLLLRAAHAVAGSAAALHGMALAAVAPAVLLLVFVSPFPFWLIGVILAGGPLLFEYSVMARNYGVSASLLFAMAALYPEWRERGVWLGVLAALLANANAHSVLLAGAFMLMWLIDVAATGTFGWSRATRAWVINAFVAAVGVGLSALTLYPPVHDAVTPEPATVGAIVLSLVRPAWRFDELGSMLAASAMGADAAWWAMSLVMFGAVAGLGRWAAGMTAGLAAMLAMSVFFAMVYGGSYRHQALWLMFMVALYWIWAKRGGAVNRAGFGCFAALLVLQIAFGLVRLREALAGGPPLSQVAHLAATLRARPDLAGAVLIPDPDFLLEAYPIYGDNPIFLPRAHRFATVSRFTREGTTALRLRDLLDDAQALCRLGTPAVLVIGVELAQAALPATFGEGYNLALSVDVAEMAALRRSTEALGRFSPAGSNETFDAYALKPPCGVDWSG